MAKPTGLEYAQGSCDYWEIQHLCNHMAGYGWTPVQLIPIPPEIVQLSENVNDDNGPMRKTRGIFPYQILFSRPVPTEDCDE